MTEYAEYERAEKLDRKHLFVCIKCLMLCRVRQNGLCFGCIGLRNDLERRAMEIIERGSKDAQT